ncbi:MAG: hypothetical protein ABW023_08215 [Sphingomonas sp.]
MFLFALLFAVQSGVTMSGSEPAATGHPQKSVPVDCHAFRANKNGSWTSIRSTKVGGVSMSAGGTFFPGLRLGDVDLAAQLNAQCKGR